MEDKLSKKQAELRYIQKKINKGVGIFFPVFLIKTFIGPAIFLVTLYLLGLGESKLILVFITTFIISLIVNAKISRNKLKKRQDELVEKRLRLQKEIVRILRDEDN